MIIWAVFRNGKPEVCQDEVSQEMLDTYSKTGDVSFLIVAHSVINVFLEEDLAIMCKEALEKDYPEDSFEVVQLHPVVGSIEWN